MPDISPRLKSVIQKQVTERSTRGGGISQKPVTVVRGKALHDVQIRATVEGHEFLSDEREEGGGHDAGPAPLRYFLASAMMCHQVWCMKTAALRDLTLDRLEGEIAGYVENSPRASDGGRGFGRVTYRVELDSGITTDEAKELVQHAATACPAFVSMARCAPIELTLLHNGQTILERTYGEVAVYA